MSHNPSDLGMPQQHAPSQKKKGWFARNWMWFLPTVILLPILCCCGGGYFLLSAGVGKMLETPAYQDSVTMMQQDAAVQQALGTPIKTPEGFTDLIAMEEQGGAMNINMSGSTTDFDARVPVSGPNASGMLVIEAQSTDGGNTWTYQVRQVEIDGSGEIIDLLPANNTPAP